MNNQNLNFYKNKKVFVTGHTGFKGSWLIFWLSKLGANIKGYSLSPKLEEDLYNKMNGNNICESIIGDICDFEKLEKEIEFFQPDIIFHLAAQPLVLTSYLEPQKTYQTNVLGTGNVMLSLKKIKKKCSIVLITTDKVYENKEWIFPYREIDSLGGYDPYSSSKAACEILISSYRNSFFNIKDYNIHEKSISVARAGNVIGGGDWSENRIIPDIINALMYNNSIKIRNPDSVRPWQHVLEPLHGYLILAQKSYENPYEFGDAWNFGPNLNDTFPVIELVKKAIKYWGNGNFYIAKEENIQHEATLLKLDISKSKKYLNWEPKMNSELAIKKTIMFYKQLSILSTKELMLEDLNDYLNL